MNDRRFPFTPCAPCAATSIIARRTIQRVGALTARKYARALACACTGWKVGGHATRVAELVRLYVFSIKFPGPRVRAARRLARAAALRSINRRVLSLALPRAPLRHLENLSTTVRCTKHRLSVSREDNACDNKRYSRKAPSIRKAARKRSRNIHADIYTFCRKKRNSVWTGTITAEGCSRNWYKFHLDYI